MKKVVVSLFFLLFALAFFATPSFALHGSFTENTKTCARCHVTHEATAKNLLNADTVFQTCKSCHDGTNSRGVFKPADKALFDLHAPNAQGVTQKIVGTFNGNSTSMSAHLSEAVVKISAAPGGAGDIDSKGNWKDSFSCSSCHNAHGSYNGKVGKYLSTNPNGMTTVPVEEGGRKLVGVPVVTQLDNNSSNEFVFLNSDGKLELKRKVRISNKGVYTTYWVDDKSPWMKAVAYNASGAEIKEGLVVRGNLTSEDDGHVKGLVPNITGAAVGQVATVDVERTYYIETPTNKADYWKATVVDADGNTVPNMAGIQLSEFCAACHTDYLTHSGGHTSKHTGEIKYGHTTDSASFTCVRCHYTHGTDVNLMVDALGRSVFDLVEDGQTIEQAQSYMSDTSSALKKFTGSSSCWACHNSSKSGNIIHDAGLGKKLDGMPAGR